MTFGARLRAIRESKGLTQEALGRGLGTDGADASKSVVYGWEKDQHHPRVDQLMLICDKLGCTADYLLFGKEAAWPFARTPLARFLSLPEPDRAYVEGKLTSAIEECELKPTKEEEQRFSKLGNRGTNKSSSGNKVA
jgi:transcriptional regulator with XRE-family HTH domain